MNWKKTAVIFLAAGLSLSITACAENSGGTAQSDPASETSVTADVSSSSVIADVSPSSVTAGVSSSSAAADSVESADESVPDSVAASSAASDVSEDIVDSFNDQMDHVRDSVFPGSAGSSLNAASAGADIMTWYIQYRDLVNADQINEMLKNYETTAEDQEEFANQIDAVAQSIAELTTESGKGALADSGWTGEQNWSQEDCQLVSEALTI